MTTMSGRGFGAGMQGFEYRAAILTGADGLSVKVPPMGVGVVAAQFKIICSTSSGKFQTTTSTIADIDAASADWDDWDSGVVSATTSITFTGKMTAFRGVSDAGTILIEVII
jgi:hypothetical protein